MAKETAIPNRLREFTIEQRVREPLIAGPDLPPLPVYSLQEWAALSGSLIFRLDESGRILVASENLATVMGFSPGAIQGRLLGDLEPTHSAGSKAAANSLTDLLEMVRQHGHISDQDAPMLDGGGELRQLRWRGWLFSGEGPGPAHAAAQRLPPRNEILLIAQACTPQPSARGMLNSLTEIDRGVQGGAPSLHQLARGVAHKLNNYFTSLLCRWDLLAAGVRAGRIDENQLHEFKQILESAAAQVHNLSRACTACPEPSKSRASSL